MNAQYFNLILCVVFVLLIYLLMIRPQRKRDKEVTNMRNGLKTGDEIVTIGGILGKVIKVKNDTVVIAVGTDRVKMEILKSAVGSIRKQAAGDAPEPVADEKEEEAPKKHRKVTPKKLTPKHEEEAAKEEAPAEEEK